MEYSLSELSIRELYEWVEKNKIDLNPSYQRNFIWSPDNQKDLIDTILKEYPLPNFFIYSKPDGTYEMVDGQQRTKTIYRFIQGIISSSKLFKTVFFSDVDQEKFLSYRIPVIFITKLNKNDSLKEFYVLINKKGMHLNIAEMNKSEFLDTNFLKLSTELLTYQNLINLNLFKETASKRMNDRAFIEELLGLLLSGIKEKRKSVESIFKTDISEDEYKYLEDQFKKIIDKIENLNQVKLISETRYRQKNDFFTLFDFVNNNIDDSIELLRYQYKILLVLDRTDQDGRQFIRPSNDDCQSLKEYANNCVTQSNSKKARENRLIFFNAVLKNTSINDNDILVDVLKFLATIYGEQNISLKNIENYQLLNVDNL